MLHSVKCFFFLVFLHHLSRSGLSFAVSIFLRRDPCAIRYYIAIAITVAIAVADGTAFNDDVFWVLYENWILNSDQIFACVQSQSHSRWGSRSHSSIAYRTWRGAVRDRCFVVEKPLHLSFVVVVVVVYRHCYCYSQRFCLSTNTCSSNSKNFVLLEPNSNRPFF